MGLLSLVEVPSLVRGAVLSKGYRPWQGGAILNRGRHPFGVLSFAGHGADHNTK